MNKSINYIINFQLIISILKCAIQHFLPLDGSYKSITVLFIHNYFIVDLNN